MGGGVISFISFFKFMLIYFHFYGYSKKKKEKKIKNLIVMNNALLRNLICDFCKNVILLHIASVQVSDDLFHNFCGSFKTK